MKKYILGAILTLASASALALNPFVEVEHQSLLEIKDYGIQTAGVGLNQNFGKFYVSGKLSTPFSNYNDYNTIDGDVLDTGDLLLNANVGFQTDIGIYVEAEHMQTLTISDWGLQTAGIGYKHNFGDHVYLKGKLATPIANYDDFHSVNEDALGSGDLLGTIRLGYSF